MRATTHVDVFNVTPEDFVLSSSPEVPLVAIGGVNIRPPYLGSRGGRKAELETIAEWGRRITAQAEAVLLEEAS